MTEIQQNRYDQLLRRVADLHGQGSKVADALGELFPVIDVERVPAELLALMGTGLAWGSSNVAGVAANNQRSQIFNPEGSGKLITVTHVQLHSSSTQDIVYGLVNVPQTSLSALTRMRDSRFGFNQQSTGEVRNGINPAAAPANAIFRQTANVTFVLFDPNEIAVLSPGFGLEFSTTQQNSNLLVSYNWRERVAQPSELNF